MTRAAAPSNSASNSPGRVGHASVPDSEVPLALVEPAGPDIASLVAVGLARDAALYDAIIQVLDRNFAAGETENVLLCGAFASFFAWSSPVGFLSDPHLERAVIDAVRGDGDLPALDSSRHKGRIVHVVTEVYAIGGHTRFAWRWMQRDHRRSDLVLTNQHGDVPSELTNSALDSGGQVYDLRSAHTSLMDRARALRRIMDSADITVFHTHPYDTIALAAAALPGERSPIVFENHADHTYWVGLGVADVVANNRALGGRVCSELRGLMPQRQRLLPVPVEPPPVGIDRDQMRAQIGISASAPVAICVATPYKLHPMFDFGFADVALTVLEAVPELTILMVGPTPTGVWQQLHDQFPGRFHALGLVGNAPALFPLADIYLDAYPISSGTALLEAAAAGLPVLSLQRTDSYSDVWIAESPGLDNDVHRATNIDDYVDKVKKLVRSPEHRAKQAATAKRNVLATHTGEEWVESLEAVYAQARDASPASLDELTPVAPGDRLHGELYRVMHWERSHLSFDATIRPLVSALSPRLKAELFAAWTATTCALDHQPCAIHLRVQKGWELRREWILRALLLAAAHPRMSLSLPPAGTDDYAASLTILLDILDEAGLTADTCGSVAVEPDEAVGQGLVAIACLAEALDFVEATLEFL